MYRGGGGGKLKYKGIHSVSWGLQDAYSEYIEQEVD